MECILVSYAFDSVDVDIFCYRVDQTLKCLTLNKKIGFYFGKGWIRKDHPCIFLEVVSAKIYLIILGLLNFIYVCIFISC
jgi:hypothetical protein